MIPTTHPKTQAITTSIAIISNHFDADPMKVGTAEPTRCPKVKIARACLWHHLHACGMSWRAIGKVWDRTVRSLEEAARGAVLKLNDSDRAMMARLPKIPNTLEISPASSAPVTLAPEV